VREPIAKGKGAQREVESEEAGCKILV